MRKNLRSAYQLAANATSANHERNNNYDAKVRSLGINLGITGKHKLQDRWKSLPYKVTVKLPDLPVYRVKPEKGTGMVKTVHQDHQLPTGYLVRMPSQINRDTPPKKPVTRPQKSKTDHKDETPHTEHKKPQCPPFLHMAVALKMNLYLEWAKITCSDIRYFTKIETLY